MPTLKYKYKLGSNMRCRVTGLTGIVTEVVECLNGCLRYGLKPRAKEDGTVPEGWFIDEDQLEMVDEGLNTKPIPKTKTGGPPTRMR